MDKDAFYKAYHQEKNSPSSNITPEVFEKIMSSDSPKTAERKPKISKTITAIDNDAFYKAFHNTEHQLPSDITPDVFEKIIREDAEKRKFVSKFTNIFEKSLDELETEQTISFPRIGVPSNPEQRVVSIGGTVPEAACSHSRVRILKSEMDGNLTEKLTKDLNRYWNPQGCFASVYPVLMKLEKQLGPGWRLDQIDDPMYVSPEAMPNSAINFNFPPSCRNYTIWRQRNPHF